MNCAKKKFGNESSRFSDFHLRSLFGFSFALLESVVMMIAYNLSIGYSMQMMMYSKKGRG